MKLVIIKNNLKEGIGVVEKATGENTSLPVLKNVLLETEEEKIKLTTTNLEIAVQCMLTGKIIEHGRVTIPLTVFSQIIGALPTERINLESKKNNLEIKTENYQALIQGTPPDDFPLIPKIKPQNNTIKINGGILKQAFLQTLPSAHTSNIHPELNSIFFTYSLDEIRCTTTDSVRLSEKTILASQFTSSYEEKFRVLIPLKTAQEAIRVIKDDDTVTFFHNQTQIAFQTERLELTSRLLEGNFPEYTHIIPTTTETEIIVSRDELINAIKLCGVLAGRINEIQIKTTENKKTIEVFSADQSSGENTYLLPAKTTGTPKQTSFNWRYLLDGLKAVTTEEVYLGIGEENKPTLIKSPKETSYFYVLMPLIKT